MNGMIKTGSLKNSLWAIILIGVLVMLNGAGNVTARPMHPSTFDEIDDFVQAQMRAHRIPGLALAIVKGDQIVHLGGYGKAGAGREMTPQTPLYIGSVSKSFTALAIMQLVEAGKVDLDAPVQKYIPWFRVADDAASSAITVRNLLNQNSGLSELGYFANLPENATLHQAVEDLRRAKPIDQVGAEFHYFNENYKVLGLLVETISGQSYADYIDDNIFTPLEMNHSSADPRQAKPLGVAQGYGVLMGFPIAREEPHPVHDAPDGQIVSTAEDMAHFLIAQLNEGRYEEAQVLSEAGVETMHRPPEGIDSPYAMGWQELQHNGVPVLAHDGRLSSFAADVSMLPEQGYGIVVLINQNGMFHSMLAYPEIPLGIINTITGAEPSTGLAMSTVYVIIFAVILISVGSEIRWWLVKFPQWREQAVEKTKGKLVFDITREFLGAALIYFGIPYLFLITSGQLLSWERGFGAAPDLIALFWFFIIMGVAKGVVKIWVSYRSRLLAEAKSNESVLASSD